MSKKRGKGRRRGDRGFQGIQRPDVRPKISFGASNQGTLKPSGHTYKESPRKKSDESAGKTMQYADTVVPYHEDIVKNFPPQ